MRGEHPILAFNRGMISRLGMSRVDLKRYPMSAATQTNFMPRVLGSAMLRPGMGYLGATRSNEPAKFLDFVFSADDTALLELTDSALRIWVDDAVIERPAISTAFVNGTFDTDLADWTQLDTGVAVSQWVSGGYMGLTGDGDNAAGRRQGLAVALADRDVEHGLRVVVARGEVDVLLGTAAGGEDIFRVTLGPGTHSLAFTPTTPAIYVDILSYTPYESLVETISFDVDGPLTLPTPWLESLLPYIRKDQSGDVVFVACKERQQRRIERRGTRSWSVALYETDDGPFRAINTGPATLSNDSQTGYTTLTSSIPLFNDGHIGALFRIDSEGQIVSRTFTDEDQYTDKIIVTGVGDTRDFVVDITNVFTATFTLQRSVGDTDVWEDTATTYNAPTSTTFNDALDNQIIAYRLAINVGDYTSGTASGRLTYQYGSITGVVRITAVNTSLEAEAVVLQPLGGSSDVGSAPTRNWYEGAWSTGRGWPSSVALYEGRLWWAGKDKWYGSVTDDFESFDPDYEGDAGPIIRSIGSGPVDVINWLLPLQQLMAGTDSAIIAGRSSSLNEPLTPSNFNPKAAATQGCASVQSIKVDDTGVFVQSGGYRVLSLTPSIEQASNYAVDDLSQLVPEIGSPGITAVAVQRRPDTRIHCIRSDGKVAVMVYDKTEDVKCWILVETDGSVEDVLVMPGSGGEEAVYYVVARSVNGSTVRYLERWAKESECIGGATSKLQDSFVTYNGSNLTHLEGEAVVGWKDGVAYSGTVSAGAVTGMPSGATVGLSYEAKFKSTKLAFLANQGETALSAKKRTHSLSLVLADTHPLGIKYSSIGFDDDDMDSLPLVEAGAEVDLTAVYDEYNYEAFSMGGEWTVDSRLYLKATAPYPCTLLAAVVGMNSNATT